MELVSTLGGCFGGSSTFYGGPMNFIEVTSVLLPAILLVVLFIRMKILAGKQVMLQSYMAKDVLMQEQKADHNYNGKLPFANFSANFLSKNFFIVLALIVAMIIIYQAGSSYYFI